MEYCSRCGMPLAPGARLCSHCGATIIAQPVVYTPPVKPKKPGQGQGIAGMILSIAALIYSAAVGMGLIFTYIQYQEELADYHNHLARYGLYRYQMPPVFNGTPFIILALVVSLPLAILAISFSGTARKKGYRCAMSGTGMTLSLIALMLQLVSLIFIGSL